MSHLATFENNYSQSKHELQPEVRKIVEAVLHHPGINSYQNASIAAQIIRLTGQLYKEDAIKLEVMHRKPVPRISDTKKAAKAGAPQKDCITCPDNVDIESILNPEIPGLKPVLSKAKKEALAKQQAAQGRSADTPEVPESASNEEADVQASKQSDNTEATSEATNEEAKNQSEARRAVMAELDRHGIPFDRKIRKVDRLMDILDEGLKGKE